MVFQLKEEQFEMIKENINDLAVSRRGIFNFFKRRKKVIDLADDVQIHNFAYSRELENCEIGIKSIPLNYNGININKLALIKMPLVITNASLERWDSAVLHNLEIQNDIRRFLDQKEQFILRGKDTRNKFDVNDLREDEVFNCFFLGNDKQNHIDLFEFRDLHEAVTKLEVNLKKESFYPPFTLMSDSETLKWAEYKYFENFEGIISFKEKIEGRREIDTWIDLNNNADNSKGNDYKLICVAKSEEFLNTYRIIENNPINIFPYNEGIIVYWCGALEIINENAIQRVCINKIR